MLESIKYISDNTDNAIVYFSTGRDSIVMLDLFHKYYKKPFTVLYLYTFKNLQLHEEIIQHYERRYNIEIIREPHQDWYRLFQKKEYSHGDMMRVYKKKYNSSYVALGYRRDEGLERLAQIGLTVKAGTPSIDHKHGYLYPLMKFYPKLIKKYVVANKLKLPITYRDGFRDIHIMKGDALVYIHQNFLSDYNTIKEQYPEIEGELIRARAKYEQ